MRKYFAILGLINFTSQYSYFMNKKIQEYSPFSNGVVHCMLLNATTHNGEIEADPHHKESGITGTDILLLVMEQRISSHGRFQPRSRCRPTHSIAAAISTIARNNR